MKLENDRNRRIAERMKNSIQLYKKKVFDFTVLLENLDFSISTMEGGDNEWKNLVLSEINTFEEIFAYIMCENEIYKTDDFSLDERTSEIITTCVDKINNELDAAIEEYKKNSDHSIKEIAINLSEGWLLCPSCLNAWQCETQDRMVICPTCDKAFHNPRYQTEENHERGTRP